MDERWQVARRILVIRLDNLGDVLLATPAIRAIRRALPRARIVLLASPAGAQVAGLNPDLDDVIVYRAPWMDPDRVLPQDPSREHAVIAALRRQGFDGAIIFTSYHQSALPAAYLCYLAGIPLRHAASVDGPGSLLTSRHVHPPRPLHEVERGLDLVAGLGIPPYGSDLVLVPRPSDREAMMELVEPLRRDGRPVIAIHAGCSCPSRTIPPAQLAAIADALSRELGAEIIWTGTAHEVGLIEGIRAGLARPGRSVAGQTDLSRLAALLAACDVALTANTGPMHVAAAVKTPVAVLFALTNPPHAWHPWGVPFRLLNRSVPCAICYQRVCPRQQECLREVTTAEVVEAIAALLEARKTSRGGLP
ncbi:MAG TPA: glycosyltransferase family 9 protein [Chloroflexota bacterium]|nr:glycosyltransferase family 9 protein [Chloroflexota bacterium]